MILECHEKSKVYMPFDHKKGCIQGKPYKSDKNVKISGLYSDLKSVFMCLYVYNGVIIFRYKNKFFELKPNVNIEVKGNPDERRLLIFVDDILKDELVYSTNFSNIIENDPTPFVENEDFDFGLWVSNISKDEARKKVLCEYYS